MKVNIRVSALDGVSIPEDGTAGSGSDPLADWSMILLTKGAVTLKEETRHHKLRWNLWGNLHLDGGRQSTSKHNEKKGNRAAHGERIRFISISVLSGENVCVIDSKIWTV